MKQRLTAHNAREIAANATVKKSPLKSPLWEKHKWVVFQAALNGRNECVIVGTDKFLIEKVFKLGMSANEIFRNYKFEKLKAEFEQQFQIMEEEREVWYAELKGLILRDKKTVKRWPELGYFLDFVEAHRDEMSAEDDLDDFSRRERDIHEEEEDEKERYTYDFDFSFEFFVKNVDAYPADISLLVKKIILAEDEYYPARCKRDKFEGDWDWDDDATEEERAVYDYVCLLPEGSDCGFIISWVKKSNNWNYSKFTGQVNGEMLAWVSSKSGQVAISEVESEVKKASMRKKSICSLVIKVGEEVNEKFFEYEFPSFEIFRVIFEFLGYSVTHKNDLYKNLSEPNAVKVSIAWGA